MFWQLICVGQIRVCMAHPILQKTKLRWVISDTTHGHLSNVAIATCHITSINELNKSLSRFWEIKHDVSYDKRIQYTPDERKCEMHFQANIFRNIESRFIVRLLTNDEKIQLDDTQKMFSQFRKMFTIAT